MGNMIFGYARVSTQDQELARQIDALGKYGVDEIFTEKMTGTKANRPELNRLKDKVRTGDTVIIESLSRLGRSTKDLLSLIEDWNHQGVKLVSLKESIDTTTPTGKLLLTFLSAISQFERDITVQRIVQAVKGIEQPLHKGAVRRVEGHLCVPVEIVCDKAGFKGQILHQSSSSSRCAPEAPPALKATEPSAPFATVPTVRSPP